MPRRSSKKERIINVGDDEDFENTLYDIDEFPGPVRNHEENDDTEEEYEADIEDMDDHDDV